MGYRTKRSLTFLGWIMAKLGRPKKRVPFTCAQCGTTLSLRPSEAKRRKYCSRACTGKSQSQKVKVECTYCGEIVLRSPSHVNENDNYCSRECRSRENTTLLTCAECNKTFRRPNSLTFNRRTGDAFEAAYCSRKCVGVSKRVNMVELECDFCGDLFERYPSEVEKAERRGYQFSFCSHQCRAHMIAAQFDPPQPYTGKHTSKPRNSRKAIEWRKQVKERDEFTCQDCGATDVMLAAHHIKPYVLFPDLGYDVSNGLTLCYPCHEKRHSLPEKED